MLSHVAKIHGYKGKQELYLRQKPVELDRRLVQIAKVQSTEASNRASGPFKVCFKTALNEIDAVLPWRRMKKACGRGGVRKNGSRSEHTLCQKRRLKK